MNYEEKEEYWKKRMQYYEDKFNKFRQEVQAVINDAIKEEEPKGKALYWMILTLENFIENEPDDKWIDLEDCKQMLEKLKAWKRLKDKGFKFEGWTIDDGLRVSVRTNFDSDGIYDECRKEVKKELDTCFGGEE